MVSAVNSSLSGVSGLGSAGSAARAPRAVPLVPTTDATSASGGVGLGSNAFQDQNATASSEAVVAAFQAQAFGQQSAAGAPPSDLLMRARRAAAAYQATTDQTSRANLPSDVQVPGLPPRLASGRMLDLSA